MKKIKEINNNIPAMEPPEVIIVGNITLSSSHIKVDKLANIITRLLANKEIKGYLDTIKEKKFIGSATG